MSADVPPSYDSVVKEIKQHVDSKSSSDEIVATAHNLTDEQIKAVMDNAENAKPFTKEEKDALIKQLGRELSSKESLPYLQKSAADAAQACSNLEEIFLNLAVTLASIDAQNAHPKEGPFTPRLKVIHDSFRRTLHKSTDLAVVIAAYGLRFEKVIIPMCQDPRLTTKQREDKLGQFIKDAEKFKEKSEAMNKEFEDLKGTFGVFVGSFNHWSSDKEEQLSKELTEAKAQLEKVKQELKRLEDFMKQMFQSGMFSGGWTNLMEIFAIVLSTGAFPTILFSLGMLFGPGIGAMGLRMAIESELTGDSAFVGVVDSAIRDRKMKVDEKQAVVNHLEDKIGNIRKARERLNKIGEGDLAKFNANISVLSGFWQCAKNDAIEVKEWLEGGAKDADIPEYMMVSLDGSIRVYEKMAAYLRAYADGVQSVGVPVP
ncbi:hypothetical protein NLJ89_g6616 [Agrocybe chaxingu]|uniref:Uncharacterized protein n=1 Tax=Agrocybe chaxingu TaxID=84603 RepID=A0A9W8JYT3_9AGAR|nr:hypothetical protein NLJ89_g6616 [Agrocybe chaxingu]